MVIGICALGALSQDTGGRTYLVNLTSTLRDISGDHRFIVFMSKGESRILSVRDERVLVVEIRNTTGTYTRIFAEHAVLPFLIKKYRIDAMYYPGNYASYYCPVPYVLAIRSMLVYNPEAGEKVSLSRHWYRKFIIPRSADRAARIITPSQHTKDEIIQFLHISPEKITVVPHGIDSGLFGGSKNEKEADEVFALHDVHRPFLLYVSALWEYKNQDKLILAFDRLIREKNIPHQLVLIGRGMTAFESYGAKLKKLTEEANLRDRVVFIDFLPHDKLKHFYQHTDVFVFPSLMESFGNSLFEAMAAGAPVVCSNTHGFPTLVKEAAILADPRNIGDLASAIDRVLSDPALRKKLLSHGKSLANSLSWSSCVQNTFSLILGLKNKQDL